jgi:hypothetical protein
MGSAKDIVEHCGVPRFVFSDFPLGNSAGKPNDPESQLDTLGLALDTLETAQSPATTVQSPQTWSKDEKWKADFYSIANLSAAELAKATGGIRPDQDNRARRTRPNNADLTRWRCLPKLRAHS